MTRTAGIIALVSVLLVAHVQAQTPPGTSGRVAPEGPYESRVRLLEDKPAADRDPADMLAATQDAYGRALLLRQLAQRGIASGDTATAIAYYEQALELDSLSPLAVAQMRLNLGQLYALAGRHSVAITMLEAAADTLPFDDPDLLLSLANSYFQDGRYTEAARRAADAIRLAGGDAPSEWLLFAVAANRQAGQPDAAARWQLQLLNNDPDSSTGWIQLAALYREAGDNTRALATLQAAALSGVLVEEDDWLRLAQLHIDYGTPDLAAQWLEPLVNASPDAQRWQWLARIRLHAGDEEDGLAALNRWAELDGSPGAWLEVGELASAVGDTDRALPALQQAAATRAPGAVRGRALLLLGELEAGRGNYRAARRAFEVASEYGGIYRVATQWLELLDRSIVEPDLPARETPQPDTETTLALDPQVVTGTPAEPVSVKTVPGLRVYAGTAVTRPARLTETALQLVEQLIRTSRRQLVEWTGPLHIVVNGDVLERDSEIGMVVAAPIRRVTPGRGDFASARLESFRCAWMRYEGPWEELAAAWQTLYDRAVASGHAPVGEARLVVLHRGSSRRNPVIELQLGIL